jgi:hypothetical protein
MAASRTPIPDRRPEERRLLDRTRVPTKSLLYANETSANDTSANDTSHTR